jgi:tripartite-type tricarboxylate transporter receptor subunit TctC
VQVGFLTVPGSIEYIRAGKLRPLAVTTANRLDASRTVGDFVPGCVTGVWYGIGVPGCVEQGRPTNR